MRRRSWRTRSADRAIAASVAIRWQTRWSSNILRRGGAPEHPQLPAYGKSVESKSLNTANRTEALRLAKALDIDFDRRILDIRSVNEPEKIGKEFAEEVLRPRRLGDPRLGRRWIKEGIARRCLTAEARAKAEKYAYQEINNYRARRAVRSQLFCQID